VGETAPRQWQVVAEGFGTPCDPFNGLWLLTANEGEGEPTTWDSEDKGGARVELDHDHDAGVWRLTFQLREHVVQYERADADWRPLNANILQGPASASSCEACPEFVTVVPV
jgi:hypothetical protein